MVKIFNFLVIICSFSEIFCKIQIYSPDIISVENSDDCRIIDSKDNSEKDRFQVRIYRRSEKCVDGSLRVPMKVNFRKFKKPVRFDEKIIESLGSGKIFDVIIPKDELKNEIFFKNIQLKSDDPNYKLDNIKIKIEPAAEIFADRKQVNFGRIYHNGMKLVAENSPSAIIRYSILKDAVCEVTSTNNFRLKNQNHYIPYSMNGLTENGEIYLSSDQNEYIANFRIENSYEKPSSGIYSDKITFSIKTHM